MLSLTPPPPFGNLDNTIHLIMMLLTHASQNTLLGAFPKATTLLLCPVCNTLSTLDSHLGTSLGLATLTGRTVRAAQAGLFDIFGTARVRTLLAFGTVRDAKATLYDTVGTILNGAFATWWLCLRFLR